MNSLSKIRTGQEMSSDGHRLSFTAIEEGHVPYNKRRWDIESSTASLEIEDYDGKASNPSPWISIQLSETTQAKQGGPFQTRTITIYLHDEDRNALIKALGGRA